LREESRRWDALKTALMRPPARLEPRVLPNRVAPNRIEPNRRWPKCVRLTFDCADPKRDPRCARKSWVIRDGPKPLSTCRERSTAHATPASSLLEPAASASNRVKAGSIALRRRRVMTEEVRPETLNPQVVQFSGRGQANALLTVPLDTGRGAMVL